MKIFRKSSYIIMRDGIKEKKTILKNCSCDIIHLADRIDVLLNNDYILHQRNEVLTKVNNAFGTMFRPELKEVLIEITSKPSFWLDLKSQFIDELTEEMLPNECLEVKLTYGELRSLFQVYAQIIDQKSKFTYRHSRLVAGIAVQLGMLAEFSPEQVARLELAGFIHDLGKLSVPESILEKPSSLTEQEFEVIQQHSYHTYHVLQSVSELNEVARWAAFHHERLDGRGYPFHISGADLDLGCRIIGVADIFSALIEDRPYRMGYSKEKIESILIQMVKEKAIDGDLVDLLFENYDIFEFVKDFTDVLKYQEPSKKKNNDN
ncbi:HD domain-containing protein [Heliobacterium chlorum]|uniref:HD domain-containing protein n=1 Tax=Heliobacterium chlorum TaxID=2698 RepID=A0ABR7T754_HELCL|nr:HD domain-containing phosphohydrolase [Heliobacterium chlorum]MBC9786210.1 HD domain-containing protein [Heliobacterium chlorum]